MPTIYVAAPYRSEIGEYGVSVNIHYAMGFARELWKCGYAAFCPHANTAHFSGADVPEERFLIGGIALLSKMDYLALLPGHHKSSGCRAEKRFAKENTIPTIELTGVSLEYPVADGFFHLSASDVILLGVTLKQWYNRPNIAMPGAIFHED